MTAGASDERIHCVELRTAGEDVPIVQELLGALDLSSSSWRNMESGVSFLWVFADDEASAGTLCKRISAALLDWDSLLSGPATASTAALRHEDWAECWKRHFHTFRASRRLVVKPSWEAYKLQSSEDIVLELDPGMSFGTGYHGTTRACLQFLDELVDQIPDASFLEAGCGSGILSLAASKLGCKPVFAFDHDEQAVLCAKENLEAARVAGVNLATADVGAYAPGRRFRIVAANILAHVLEANAEAIFSFLERDSFPSHLILAGILTEQYGQVKDCYEPLGLREIDRQTIDEWTSGLYVTE
ncbi:MAG: 50S ribosomal protein L11 methyltransferase [Lentisphaeria bacterium]|nr:50S ribosomal protein L11 methyltransferase [Lentisphaeria bacterium]